MAVAVAEAEVASEEEAVAGNRGGGRGGGFRGGRGRGGFRGGRGRGN